MKLLYSLLFFTFPLILIAQSTPPEKKNEAIEDSVRKYDYSGNYEKALSFALQLVGKVGTGTSEDSSAYATALNVLGRSFQKVKKLKEAEHCLLKSIGIRKKNHGLTHPDVANSLYSLGILYYEMGDFSKAESYQLQAFDLRKKIGGLENPNAAASLNSLGILYRSLGDFGKAEQYYLQALDIFLKTLGHSHRDIAPLYNNLGSLYWKLKKYSLAEEYFIKALETANNSMGPLHPLVSQIMNNLGILYGDLGEFIKAEQHFLFSIEIRKKTVGAEHPDVATPLTNLANLYRDLGEKEKAEPCYHKALEIRKKTLGLEHPDVAFSLYNLGSLYRSQGEILKAYEFHKEFENLNKKLITRFFPSLSEQEREAYMKMGIDIRENLVSFWAEEGVDKPQLRTELFDHQLFYKGMLLNAGARWKQRIKTSGDLKLIRRYDEWEFCQQKISKLLTSTDPVERSPLDSLLKKAEILEKELSQRSENFARLGENKFKNWDEIRQTLKPGEAAIEMVRFRKYGILKIVTDTSAGSKLYYTIKGLTDTIQYAALILTKKSSFPEMVILKEGMNMEGRWFRFYRNSIQQRDDDVASYNRFWKPIAKFIKGINKIFFSSDGVYHKINLSSLKNPDSGKYLMDELEIANVGSSKDLIQLRDEDKENHLAFLLGNPEFDNTNSSGLKSRSGPDLSYYLRPNPNFEIPSLPGTLAEVNQVAGLLRQNSWEVQEFVGPSASEDIIKDSYKPRVMLISTHGFFYPDSGSGSNPLLRSGLLLTGSAKTLRDGHRGEGEDGILTAYEAMNLNLDNTELVVLSACETGLGDIKNGEGVYGLQRAFQVAGARNLIMSLWKVDDEVTQKLMTSFFRHWISGIKSSVPSDADDKFRIKDNIRKAFLEAQMEIRTYYPQPYFWGGFILLGK